MKEKTLGQVLWEVFNRDYEEERFCNLTSINKTRHEQSAQAVIAEYLRRNGEPVAWVWNDNEGIGGSPRTRYSDAPPGRITNAQPLFKINQSDQFPLQSVIAACGWQGGTVWQVIDEIRRLKEENKRLAAPQPLPTVEEIAYAILRTPTRYSHTNEKIAMDQAKAVLELIKEDGYGRQ